MAAKRKPKAEEAEEAVAEEVVAEETEEVVAEEVVAEETEEVVAEEVVAEEAEEVVAEEAVADTVYGGYAATATVGEVSIPEEAPTQRWYSNMAGQTVPCIILKWFAPHLDGEQTTFVYDGDGSGTRRYIGGDEREGTQEIDPRG